MILSPLLSVLLACKAPTPPEVVGEWLDGSAAIGVDVVATTGAAPLTAKVRAVNAWGASVTSGPLAILVDGEQQLQSFDAWGYGELVVDAPHTAWVQTDTATVPLTATLGRWEGLGLMASAPAPDTALDVQPGTGGQVVVTAHEAWWVSPNGELMRVLSLADRTLGGVRTVNVDGDPYLDAVVWADDLIVLLRGRPDGGLAWATGLQAPGYHARGVVARDLTGDDRIDIAVAWEPPDGGGALQVWEGDGLFGFTDWPLEAITEAPQGLAVGDNMGDGSVQLTTLLDQAANWQRFAIVSDTILGTGPTLPSVGYTPGADVLCGGDLNGDGGEELFLFGPRRDGIDREVRIYDFVGDNVQYVPMAYTSAYLSLADGNVDGAVDLFALEPRVDSPSKLMQLSWGGIDYAQRKAADLDAFGPFAFTAPAGGLAPNLLVAGSTWQWWLGGVDALDSGDWWKVEEPIWGSWDQGITGPITQVPPASDATPVAFAGMVIEAGQTVLKRWGVNPAATPSIQQDASAIVADTPAAGRDLAVCGDIAWALVEGQLTRIDLTAPDGAPTSLAIDASAVACGLGPGDAVAAVLSGDAVHWLGDDLVERSTEAAPGAVDLAIGSVGGVPGALTCATAGCSVVAWPVGDELLAASTEGGVTTVQTDAGPRVLEGPGGALSVWDANADGTTDLISVSGQTTIGLFLASPDGFGAGHFVHTRQALVGAAIVGDATGDGLTDLLIADASGKLFQSLGLPAAR